MYNNTLSAFANAPINEPITKEKPDNIMTFFENNIANLEDAAWLIFKKKLTPILADIVSKSRRVEYVDMRHLFMYYCRRAGYTFETIGFFIGGRDHSTAMHGFNKIKEFIYIYNIDETQIKINGIKGDSYFELLNFMRVSTKFSHIRKLAKKMKTIDAMDDCDLNSTFLNDWNETGLNRYNHLLSYLIVRPDIKMLELV